MPWKVATITGYWRLKSKHWLIDSFNFYVPDWKAYRISYLTYSSFLITLTITNFELLKNVNCQLQELQHPIINRPWASNFITSQHFWKWITSWDKPYDYIATTVIAHDDNKILVARNHHINKRHINMVTSK